MMLISERQMKEGSRTLLLQLVNLAKKPHKLAVDMNYMFENRNNWFSKPSLLHVYTATSHLYTHLVFKHAQKPDKLISNAR